MEAPTYERFKEALLASGCVKCPLSAGRTNIVVDRGNPEAKVLLIGEAPGENEDLQGKAFVGRSGKLLDRLMKEAGFDTERDGLIINVVKCRPPDNRKPKPDEVESCRPFLDKQIALVRPKFVLLLGATALRHVIRGKAVFSMRDEAGKFFEHPAVPGARFMVLFHPAYLLRDPRKVPLMVEHLKRFADAWKREVVSA